MGLWTVQKNSAIWTIIYALLVPCMHGLIEYYGGSIVWAPTGNDNEIRIDCRLSWYKHPPDCNASITNGKLNGEGNMICFNGCSFYTPLLFDCTDFSAARIHWASGLNAFTYSSNTMGLSFGFNFTDDFGSWLMKTTANLSFRPDTNRINSSPTVDMVPIMFLQYGCQNNITIPVYDADGDIIRCRFARLDECGNPCNIFPANLTDCVLQFSYNGSGSISWYMIAIQIEDFLSASSTTPLSSVSLQLLVSHKSWNLPCNSRPVFLPSTPEANTCFHLNAYKTFSFSIDAASLYDRIVRIDTVKNGPSTVFTAVNSTGSLEVKWTPVISDAGSRAFCFVAIDTNNRQSESRCVYLFVEAKPNLVDVRTTENGSYIAWQLVYDKAIERPSSSAFILIYDENDTVYASLNVTSGDVQFGGSYIRFGYDVNLAKSYYVLLNAGVVLGGCRQPSDQMINKSKIVVEKKDCGALYGINNGSLMYNGTTYGETATYRCDPGFVSNESLIVRKCTEDGTWSGEIPNCVIKDCGALYDINNGYLTYNGTTYGETATYKCDPGFDISNENFIMRKCTEDGIWSGERPDCVIKDCGALHGLGNGSVTYNSTTYGETATYKCDTGFDISNESFITRECTDDGIWSGEIPYCIIKDCLKPPIVAQGTWEITSTYYGGQAKLTCDLGHLIIGDFILSCGDDQTWQGEQPVCTIVDCNAPYNLENGSVTYNGTTYGETARYTCNTGYYISNESLITRHCNENGSWSGETPFCTFKDCHMPVDVEFAQLTYTGTTYGEYVTYTCNDGYFLRSGNNARHCEADALWNGSTPSCIEKFHAGSICLADVTGVSQCLTEDVSCRFDAATGTFRCLCSEGRILSLDREAKCLEKSEYGETCQIGKQCTTFLSECIQTGIDTGTCGCPGGTSYNKTADECTTNAVSFCQAGTDRLGLWWNKTRVLTTAYQQCPTGSSGQIIRICRADGIFSTALYNCTKEVFNIINNQMQSTNMTTTQALGSLHEALDEIRNSSSEIHAGDVDGIENVLMQITEKEANGTTTVEQIKQNAQRFFDIADMLTDPQTSGPAWESKIEQTSTGAERFIETIDRFSFNLATTIETSNETKVTIQKENLVVSVSKVSEDPDTDLKYPDEGESHPFNTSQTSSFTLSSESLAGQSDKVTSVVVVVYRDISKALPKTTNSAQQRYQSTDRTISSQVLSIQLLPKPPEILNPPIQLTFNIDNRRSGFESHCAFWTSSTDGTQGGWSTSGCVRTMANATTVQCSCNHLTNFAILTSPIETPSEHKMALTAISLTGCGVSIVCLVITIILHVSYWRLLKGDRNVIAMTVCVSLLLAYLLFVFGVTRTSVKGVCTTVAVLLHYTFLLVFFLLLAEGIYMALQIVLPFHKKSHLKELLIGAFAIPALFVLIVASATELQGYGNDKYCWLTVDSVAFWMFVGPALLVIIFNLAIIILIIKKMYGTKWIKDMNQREKAKTLASKTLVMLPVMGVTWLFGILSVHESTIWLQYLFVFFNSFQGLFIFLFHCILNRQLRAAIAKSRQQFSTISEVSSRSRAATDHSTNQTTITHIEPPSTVTYDAKTDLVTTASPAYQSIIEDDPPAIVSEEEKQMFKKRHAIPLQTAVGENKPRRPPTQVFIDLQHELRGRLRNLAHAVTARASKMFNSAQRDTVMFTRNVSKQSLQKQPQDDQVEIINDEAENGDDSVEDGSLEAEIHAVVIISLGDEEPEDCTDSKEYHGETNKIIIEDGKEEREDILKERDDKQTEDNKDLKEQGDEKAEPKHASRNATIDVMIDPIENVNGAVSVLTNEEPGDTFCQDDNENASKLASE